MFPLSMSAAFGALLYELSTTKTRKLHFLMRVHSVNLTMYLTVTALYFTVLHLITIIVVLGFSKVHKELLEVVAGANIVCVVVLVG